MANLSISMRKIFGAIGITSAYTRGMAAHSEFESFSVELSRIPIEKKFYTQVELLDGTIYKVNNETDRGYIESIYRNMKNEKYLFVKFCKFGKVTEKKYNIEEEVLSLRKA